MSTKSREYQALALLGPGLCEPYDCKTDEWMKA